MKSSEKFKLCPSCDGRAPLEVVICPFCAQSFNDPNLKAKSNLSSSYVPPYSAERVTPIQAESKNVKESVLKQEVDAKEKSVFLPIALLTIGSNLLILALLLLMLSHDGKVELEWSSSYWMIYAGLGLPLLLLGFKIIKKEEN